MVLVVEALAEELDEPVEVMLALPLLEPDPEAEAEPDADGDAVAT